MCVGVVPKCMFVYHMHEVCSWTTEEGMRLLRLELQKVLSHHDCAEPTLSRRVGSTPNLESFSRFLFHFFTIICSNHIISSTGSYDRTGTETRVYRPLYVTMLDTQLFQLIACYKTNLNSLYQDLTMLLIQEISQF